jgi:protein MAK16
MQSDEIIWQVINHHFCSFKAKVAKEKTFCRNEYNVSGMCNKSSCPLANSRYATIREEKGLVYLYMKTIERAHSPKKLWEKVELPRDYEKALEVVSKELEYFPKFLKHKNKQRLTKIHQYLVRIRRLTQTVRPKIVGVNKKLDKREAARERKALRAAQLEKAIEQELIDRLKQGTYGDIYNFPQRNYKKVLDTEGAVEQEVESDENDELAEEDDEENGGEELSRAFVEDFSESDVSDMEDYYSDESSDDSSDEIDQDHDSSSSDSDEYDGEDHDEIVPSNGNDGDDNDDNNDSSSRKRDKPSSSNSGSSSSSNSSSSTKKKKKNSNKRRKIPRKSNRPYVEVEYEKEIESNDGIAMTASSSSW